MRIKKPSVNIAWVIQRKYPGTGWMDTKYIWATKEIAQNFINRTEALLSPDSVIAIRMVWRKT